LEGCQFPDHTFFCAAHTGSSDANRPYAGGFVEMASRASGMGNWSLAAQLVQTPPLAVTFITKRCGKAPRIKVCPPRAILVDHTIVGELGPTILVECGKFAHGHVFENDREQVVRVGRTARKVH